MKRFGKVKISAMHSGGVGVLQVFIYILIALVSFYGDAVFVWMNIGHYSGSYAVIFQIFLVLGAFCTSASIMSLLFGKAYWFRPGPQLIWAYIFTAAEVTVNVLNIVIALNPNLGLVDLWRIISPATPFVALIGWILILQLDKSQRERHAQMEMEEQKNDAEREYEMMVHQANMDLKFGYLDQTKQRLHAALNSPMAQQIVEQHAQNLTAQVLNEITGLPVMQQQQQPTLPPALPQHARDPFYPVHVQEQIDHLQQKQEQTFTSDQVWRMLEAVQQDAAKQSSPLAQPHLTNDQANQTGSNGQNGHSL